MYAAIDALADKLDRQVVKHKEKRNGHRHPPRAETPAVAAPARRRGKPVTGV
jgi:ribosome-associated translation inhibitor RaiA